MTESDEVSELERRVRYSSDQDRRERERLENREGLTASERGRLADLRHCQPILKTSLALPPPSFGALPPYADRVLASPDLAELQAILAIVRDTHDELVGTRLDIAHALLAGDERVLHVRGRLRAWAQRYVAARLSKPNSRDTDQLKRFERIAAEFVPFFEHLIKLSPVETAFLRELPFYIPLLTFEGTWADRVDFQRGPGLRIRTQPRFGPPIDFQDEWGLLSVAVQARQFPAFFEALETVALPPSEGETTGLLDGLASNIREMRPVLIRGFNPVKASVQVASDMYLAWDWGDGQVLGHLTVFESERDLFESQVEPRGVAALRVEYDGTLASDWAPWVNVASLSNPHAVSINVHVLDLLNERLYGIFGKHAEHAARLKELREATSGSATEELSEEHVALGCQEIARRFDEEDAEDENATARPLRARCVPKLRLKRFLNVLSRVPQVEIESGKGSEVKVYRQGGKPYRIGRHTANPEMPSNLVWRVLQRLGISDGEWIAALG